MPLAENSTRKELLKRIEELETEKHKRKAIEEKNEEITERLELLLHALPVGIVIIDYKTQRIIDVNPHALMAFGCSLDKLIGKNCQDYICPADKGNCPIIDQKLNLDRSEREILTIEKRKIPVLKTVVKTEIEGKKVLVECFIDISDKKNAEKEHLKREKLQAVLEMAGAVCHEFNQPLQVINGYCELLKNNFEPDSENREFIEKILKEGSKLGSLTGDVMNITEYETKPYLNSKIVDIKRSSAMRYGDK